MYYSPVLITTLNRYEHLKRCIESLERCTGAEYTDVHIALDYPPSNKYLDGWKKIDDYLKEKETNHKFKNFIIYRRERNYGVCQENDNFEVLISDISKKYDRFITTEDDNEFSPCFLQYMNKALEKFYDDARINLICGYNYKMKFPKMYRNNFYITKYGCPWGTGEWVHKRAKYKEYKSIGKLTECLRDDEFYEQIKKNPHVLRSLISMLKKQVLWDDGLLGMYSTLYDTYCILPRESMVRNWGNDGTGEHNKKRDVTADLFYSQQPISDNTDFEFTDDIFTYEPIHLERCQYKPKKTVLSYLKNIHSEIRFHIDLFLFRRFNYIPQSKLI